jgi:hypothetical protein
VVTVVDGGATLEGCLDALAAQRDPPELEVLVPRDPTLPDLSSLVARYGERFRIVEMEPVSTERAPHTHAGQHELYDRRRSRGLAAARGELVAILEDRSRPVPEWAAIADRLHAAAPAVIGGAIANGIDRMLNWAVYFCDFGRYEPPIAPGPAPWVSDVNVVYKRRALEATRELWAERYHETTVHWALLRAGETLYLSPEPLVHQHRAGLRLGELLRERFHWGRLFAGVDDGPAGAARARRAAAARAAVRAAASRPAPPSRPPGTLRAGDAGHPAAAARLGCRRGRRLRHAPRLTL